MVKGMKNNNSRKKRNNPPKQMRRRRGRMMAKGSSRTSDRLYTLGSTAPPSMQVGLVSRERGSDSIFLTQDVLAGGLDPGQLITRVAVNAQMGKNIKLATAQFQEFKFEKLRVSVAGQGGAITTGQFVISFMADPLDSIPVGVEAVGTAIGQANHQIANYRDKCVVDISPGVMMGTTGGWYRTNEGDGDPRLANPGYVDLTNITAPNQSVGLLLLADWEISRRSRTVGNSYPVATARRSFGVSADDNVDTPYKPELVYNSTVDLLPEDFTPSLQREVFYKLPAEITMAGNTGASGAPSYAVATHIASANGTSVELFRFNPTTGAFVRIDDANFPVKPSIISGPLWEQGTRFAADSKSPAYKLGF